jgi:uncharacterized protein
MEPADIISKYYDPQSHLFRILTDHSRAVADKAVAVAGKMKDASLDIGFIYEAAMLHDIGIIFTNTPVLDCHGKAPYVCHGYLGRKLLEREKLPEHGLVCERHVGVGLTREEIVSRRLPLPPREMVPVSIEEQIVCYADKFFSKDGRGDSKPRSVDEVIRRLSRYGKKHADIFVRWMSIFGTD